MTSLLWPRIDIDLRWNVEHLAIPSITQSEMRKMLFLSHIKLNLKVPYFPKILTKSENHNVNGDNTRKIVNLIFRLMWIIFCVLNSVV